MRDDIVLINTSNGEIELSQQIIKKYLARGGGNITDSEAMLFLNLCKYNNLNPFLNEAYLIKFGNQPAQMVVGKDSFIKKANANPTYKGMKAGIIVRRNEEFLEIEGSCYYDTDKIVGGWAEIHVENRIPFKHSVAIREYIGRKKDGSINSMWKEKPATMIRKVAIAQALREALPESFQNMYTEEEVNIDTNSLQDNVTTVEVIKQDDEVIDLSEDEEVPFIEPNYVVEVDNEPTTE